MTVVQQLLHLRSFREQRAQSIVQLERAALVLATQQRDAAASRLQEFQDLLVDREQELFSELMKRTVLVRDIESVRYEVADLRLRERGFADALDQAELARSRQEDAVSSARSNHQLAEKARQKFVELRSTEKMAHQARIDQAEEVQIEELARSTIQPDRIHEPGSEADG